MASVSLKSSNSIHLNYVESKLFKEFLLEEYIKLSKVYECDEALLMLLRKIIDGIDGV